MNSLLPTIFKMMSWMTGQAFNPLWEEKLPFILRGLFLMLFFIILFVYFYHKYFWQEKSNRRLFFLSIGIIFLLIIAKYILYHFSQGYVSDRMFFYALPSPRIKSVVWFALPNLIAIIFLLFRYRLDILSEKKFLAAIFVFFVCFTLSVAGIRDGFASIADPMTRTYWEYTGSLPLISEIGVKNFLGQYNHILSQLPIHMQTHPPGYVIFLFFWHKLLSVSYLGLSIILVFTAGLTILPLFYLWKSFFSPLVARKMLQIFVFIPSLVMFSGTSTEAFFVLLVWLSIAFCFFGWKSNWWLSLIAGMVWFYCVFSNFLFLLLAPFFLFLLIHLIRSNVKQKIYVVARAFVSLFVLIIIFVLLWRINDYSIVDNFIRARAINNNLIESNFLSIGVFMTYFFMNLTAFLTYFGIPLIVVFLSKKCYNWMTINFWHIVGAGVFLLFILIGIFQGEVERIWLFLIPFFVVFPACLYTDDRNVKQLNMVSSLLFFQIIIFQVLFYTYW